MNPTIISVMSAMAAAAWSVWTWQSERQKVRDLKRDEMSAQYVNNLIVATQELQRKLFKILEENELALYRSKYVEPIQPASPVAIELLCLLSAFFGWGFMTFRFGPYSRDSKMITMLAQIGEVFESRSRFPGDAFRFSLSDRHALGQAVLRRVGETSFGPVFVTITRFKFEDEMQNERSEWASLFRSEEVRCTLEAIDRAVQGETLEGRERLAFLQNLLVDLLSYLEQKEGFRVSFGERGRATVDSNQTGVVQLESKDVRILHEMPGRIRLGIPRLHGDVIYAAHLQLLLQKLEQVNSVRANVDAACVVIEYSNSVPLSELLHAVLAIVDNASGNSPDSNTVQWQRVIPETKLPSHSDTPVLS
jgi:hypothetical protein